MLHHKFKQISAKWGKQWGKHYPHFAAFFCIRKNSKNAETLCYKAFWGFLVKSVTGILVPSGPQVIPKFSGFFMPFFVYIIKCLQDGTYYKGSIENYLQRLNYQNAGKSRYISAKVPWKLIYDEEKPDK